ncbi:MAG: hypothetical protein R2763_01275 [Mycobacterium sp.]
MIEDGPFFELCLTGADGRRIAPQRFRTVQDAMTVAEDYREVSGAILYFEGPDAEPVPVIVYSADGSIDVGEAVPDDDEYEDDPWTDAEIEHNFRVSEEIAERKARGESVRSEDLESNSPAARAELHARVEAERAERSSDE